MVRIQREVRLGELRVSNKGSKAERSVAGGRFRRVYRESQERQSEQ